jgi:D-alanyl-D-alanine carboxypeptidase/D-alanyl-D-alanine-endopeptidase (penicillin-binding protein 4)
MRRAASILFAGIAMLLTAGVARAAPAPARGAHALRRILTEQLARTGGVHGAYVVDLTSGQTLFGSHIDTGRIPASVQKLYTTSTALLRLGPSASFETSVLGSGRLSPSGTWQGTLYLRGGGDPTFGSATFDRAAYGAGATVQALARRVRAAGIKRVSGPVVGDESLFDSLRGTPATGYAPSFYLEGQLSALAYDRGFSNAGWSAFQADPPRYAARKFVAALRAVGVRVPKGERVSTGITPKRAHLLASVDSPDIAKLIRLTNTPSDNFLAETLLKDLGADFAAKGSTAAGTRVVRRELARRFGIAPRFNDGSGLSPYDRTTPRQVVRLLRSLAGNRTFVDSLAIAGETGTLKYEMRGTRAQGRCRGKTGTLHDVASLVGYCVARDGHTLAFAFLLNGLTNPDYGHEIEAKMDVAVANYDGRP